MAFGDNRKTSSKLNISALVGAEAATNIAENELPIELLVPYNGGAQPFRLYDDEKKAELVESIKINGLLSPIIVRPISGGMYEILAGHNRVEACKVLEIPKIKSIVMNELTDEQAKLVVVDTNLCQRTKLLPSERAHAYLMQQEALKAMKVRATVSTIAERYAESNRTIQRYISLNNLIPALMERTDNEDITFRTAVTLSSLSEENQSAVEEFIALDGKIDEAAAKKIVKAVNEEDAANLTSAADITRLLKKTAKNTEKKEYVRFDKTWFEEIASDIPKKYYDDYIWYALQQPNLRKEFMVYMKTQEYKQDIIDHFIALYTDEYAVRERKNNSLSDSDFAKAISKQSKHRGTCSSDYSVAGNGKGICIKWRGHGEQFPAFDVFLPWTKIAKRASEMLDNNTFAGAKSYRFSEDYYLNTNDDTENIEDNDPDLPY